MMTFNNLDKNGCIPQARRIGSGKKYWLSEVVDAWIILAFDYPIPLPTLPPQLLEEVKIAAEKARKRGKA